jgi:hypothetical protein
MVKQLVNYAFTTAIYEEKRNFLETFSPFVLKILYVSNCQISDHMLSEELKTKYQVDIPINTIKSIITGLATHDLVFKKVATRDSWQVCINTKGKKEVELSNENEESVRRRQIHLVKSFVLFLASKGLTKTENEAEELIINFVHNNLHKLSIFKVDDIYCENQDDILSEKENFYLTQFIEEIYRSEPILYETYEEVLKGLVIWEYIKANEDTSVIPRIESLVIYLDANIVLSLLEFHNPAINAAAKQLFNLLKETEGVKLKIFSITLQEIARLLTNFKNIKDNYTTSIPVNSVFYYLKSKGFNDLKTDALIQGLDHKIEGLGIMVEKLDMIEDLNMHGNQGELYKDIYTYKKEQNETRNGLTKEERVIHASALHDANIILAIQRKRGSWVKTLERSKAIFLTSSYLMDQFCKRISRQNDRFPEVILDLTLTNILWLRNPKKEIGIHLHQLISAHSKRFIVDNGIWNRFFSTIKTMNEDGIISTEEMASVISNNQITLDYLHHVNVDDISVDTVLELAKKVEEEFISKDKLLEEREKIIAEKQNETEQIEKELEEKDSALQDLKNKNQTLSEQLNTTSSDVEELKKERDRDRFIDKKMEENFDPLANKGIHLLVSIFVGFFLMYLAEIADEFDYKWAGIPYKYHKVFKMIGFLYPLILTIYNKEQTGQVFQFYFSKRSLKRKMEKRFSEEFDKQ